MAPTPGLTPVLCVRECVRVFAQALYGMFIFGESLPLQWWCGAGLIAAGVACLALDNPEHQQQPSTTTTDATAPKQQ